MQKQQTIQNQEIQEDTRLQDISVPNKAQDRMRLLQLFKLLIEMDKSQHDRNKRNPNSSSKTK